MAKHIFRNQLGQKPVEPKIKPTATLELLACPYCGVFTTTPCTNPDCPGRGI